MTLREAEGGGFNGNLTHYSVANVGNSALHGINFANILSTVCESQFLTCLRNSIITRNCTAVRNVSTVVSNAAGGLTDV